jgi:hypothetical protein
VKVATKDGFVMAKSEKDSREVGRLAAIASEFEMNDLEDEMDAATPEEREKILEREGWTRDEMLAVHARTRAKLKEKLAELEKAAPSEAPAVKPASTQAPPPDRSNVVELSSWRRRVVRYAAGPVITTAALAAGFFGVFLPATHQQLADINAKPVATGAGAGPGNWDLSDPFIMRHEGMSLCAAEDYTQCLEWLDRAYAKDPTGELAWPRVQFARKHAMDVLAAQRDH